LMAAFGRPETASPLRLDIRTESGSYCDLHQLYASQSYLSFRKLADAIYARRNWRDRFRSLFKSGAGR
jgi:hypothetical protein